MGAGFAGLNDSVRQDVLRRLDTIAAYPHVEKVYIYGSYAKGTEGRDSDIDVAVFLDTPEDCLIQHYRALARICLNADVEIQVQTFRVNELADPCGIVEEIVAYGYEYHPNDTQ